MGQVRQAGYIRLSMEEEGMQDGNWDGDGTDPSPF